MSLCAPRSFQEARGQLIGLLESFAPNGRDKNPRQFAKDLAEFANSVASFAEHAASEFTPNAEPEFIRNALFDCLVRPVENGIQEAEETEVEDLTSEARSDYLAGVL